MSLALQHFQEPRLPKYIYYGFVNELNLKDSILLLQASFFHQTAISLMSLITMVIYGVIIRGFGQSMHDCLDVLMAKHRSTKNLKGINNLEDVQRKVESYLKLEQLTDSFNHLFKWIIFGQYSGCIVFLCFVVYIPLRYWNEADRFTILECIVLALFVIYGIIWNFVSMMGMVWDTSAKFRCVMRRLLLQAQESIMIRDSQFEFRLEQIKLAVSTCEPFGFQAGVFFIYRSNSVLTVFYAVLTHIIIMLQLDL